jgi:NADPH:quinone reductase-like Zn-dependent oxidoreductase
MRALRYATFGPLANVLRTEELPEPQPGADDVLVRAHYVGVNPLDWKLVEGHYRLFAKSRPPCGVGAEFAGEIVAIGAGVRELSLGDRIVAWLNPFSEPPRALAECVRVPATQCVRVPAGIDLDRAAVTPVAGLSALQLVELVEARAGQRILVHGAAGGVGSFVVPMLRARGAVVVASGSAASQDYLRTLRPDYCIDYATSIETWTGPFSAIIDCASTLERASVPRLMQAGRIATTLPSFPYVISDTVFNRFRRIRWHALRLEPSATQLAQIFDWIADGQLSVPLTKTYDFEQAIDALAESRKGRVRGKVVVAVA